MPGKALGRVWGFSLAAVAAVCLWAAPGAGADTVLVGSPMPSGFPNFYTSAGSRATVANVALGEPGANVTSPVNGTIVQWRVSSTGVGQFAIRVLHPVSGHYVGAGTSSGNVPSAGLHSFAANLPIQAGDLLAIDIPDANIDGTGINGQNFGVSGSTFGVWIPPVADGGPSGFEDDFTGQEMLFNADVQFTPSTTPPAPAPPKKCKKKKKHKRSALAAKKCKKKGKK